MLTSLKTYITNPYFSQWFVAVCFTSYVISYLLVRILAWSQTNSSTQAPRVLITKGFQSWLVPFLLHSFVMLSTFLFLAFKLWKQKQMAVDWIYLPPMLMIFFFDLALLASINRKKQEILSKLR